MASRIRLHITGAFFAILLLASIGPAAGNLWASLSPQGNDQDPPDIEPLSVDPPDPYNFDVVASEQTSLDLSWDGQQTGIVFELQRGTTTLESSWGQETYTDTGLGCGTSYNYKVRSWGDGSQPWNHNSSNWVTTSGTTDSAAAAFSSSSYTATEGSSTTITVNLDCNIGKDVIIPVTVTPGTNRSVSISKGNSSGTFSFSPSDDNSDCNDETISLGFGNLPSGVTAGSPASATVSVSDNDSPTVRFSPSSYTATEGGSSTSVTLSLNCAPGQNVSIPITGNDGTNESVSIGSSSTSGSFDFSASGDTGCTGGTVTLSFGTLPAAVSQGSPASATVNVLDPDRPAVSFDEPSYTVTEGASNQVRVNMSCSIDDDADISLTVSTGGYLTTSVSSGDNFGFLTFYGSHDSDCDNDNVGLTFFSLPSGWTEGSQGSATVTVLDDDSPQAKFSDSSYDVVEGSSTSITVQLTCKVHDTNPVEVDVSVTPGTDQHLSFPMDVTSQSFTFSPSNDDLDCNDETVSLNLLNPVIVGLGSPSSATIAIEDDEVCLDTPILDVVPLPRRMAWVIWPRDFNADNYIVQVRDPIVVDPNNPTLLNLWLHFFGDVSCPVMPPALQASVCGIRVHLDKIILGVGLDNLEEFEFKVQATDSTGNYLPSDYSSTVIIEDTRLNPVNGNSLAVGPSKGKAEITWTKHDDATTHRIRYRQLGTDQTARSHSHAGWQIDTSSLPLVFQGNEPVVTSSQDFHRIENLTLNRIYAIQLTYYKRVACGTAYCYTKVFAARDMYVWPSKRTPTNEFVGGFPMNPGLPVIDGKRTYSYRICESTFTEGKRDAWRTLINQAAAEWTNATDGLVQTVFDSYSENETPNADQVGTSKPCIDYTPFMDRITDKMVGQNYNLLQVRFHLNKLFQEFHSNKDIVPTLAARLKADSQSNDIQMMRDRDMEELWNSHVFHELGGALGNQCNWRPPWSPIQVAGCVILPEHERNQSGTVYGTIDIIIRQGYVEDSQWGAADDPLTLPEVRMNVCSTNISRAYSAVIHEVGHALGLWRGDHNALFDTVMNWREVPDCAPYPLDVMAIYALYQNG